MTVWRYPQVLVMHLKRFVYNNTLKKKLDTKINVPLTIDMKPFAPYSSITFCLSLQKLDRAKLNMSYMEYLIIMARYMEGTMLRKIYS